MYSLFVVSFSANNSQRRIIIEVPPTDLNMNEVQVALPAYSTTASTLPPLCTQCASQTPVLINMVAELTVKVNMMMQMLRPADIPQTSHVGFDEVPLPVMTIDSLKELEQKLSDPTVKSKAVSDMCKCESVVSCRTLIYEFSITF